ncbi:hypothetical protein Tco_0776931, partial [Tanacetum coccineum]
MLSSCKQQQHAADVYPDELSPPNKRYDLMDANKKVDLEHVQCPSESKILMNIIKNHPLRFSIAASASVPWIYMAQFWHTLKEDGSKHRLNDFALADLCKIFSSLTTRVTMGAKPPTAVADNAKYTLLSITFMTFQDVLEMPDHNLQDDDIKNNNIKSGIKNYREEQEARENVALVYEHLAAKEIEKLVEDPENVDDSSPLGSYYTSNFPSLGLEPMSDKEIQVDASIRSYMSGHILFTFIRAQFQSSSDPEQQHQLNQQTACKNTSIRTSEIHLILIEDLDPEGIIVSKKAENIEYEAYGILDSHRFRQVNVEEPFLLLESQKPSPDLQEPQENDIACTRLSAVMVKDKTATASTLANGTLELRATIDTIVEYNNSQRHLFEVHLNYKCFRYFPCLPNTEILEGCPKSGGWDQFGSNLATALICLSTSGIYNFSKLIFDGIVANLKSKTKFLMYPRFLQMILEIQTENKHPYLAIVLTKKIFGNMKRGFRGVPRPLLPAMLPVVAVDQSAGPADQAKDQPSSSEPLPSSSHPPVISATIASEPTPVAEPTTHHTSPSPEPDNEPTEHIFEQPSPEHQPLSPRQETAVPQSQDPTHPHVPEARTMTVEDLLHLVPNLITKVDSLETELKQTKLTMGKAIVKLVKKVKKLEDILKRRHVVLTDSEDEEPEDQGRIIQDINDDPLVSKGDFVTPTKPSGEAQEEEISPTTLEAAKTLSKVASQRSKSVDKGKRYKRRKESKGKDIDSGFEDISTGFEEVNTGFEKVNTGGLGVSTGSGPVSSARGQREGKAPMIVEETQAPKRTKEQIQQEEASLAEAIRLQTVSLNLLSRTRKFSHSTMELRSLIIKEEEPVIRTGKRKKQKARKGINVDKSPQGDSETDEEESVEAMNPTPLDTKSNIVANWKIFQQGERSIYQIIRANGADTVYMSFGAMLKDFTREDLIELYRLVMQKYGTNRPEDVYDRVLWSDLRTMFDPPLNEDAIWSLPLQQKIISWRKIIMLQFKNNSKDNAHNILREAHMKNIQRNLKFTSEDQVRGGLLGIIVNRLKSGSYRVKSGRHTIITSLCLEHLESNTTRTILGTNLQLIREEEDGATKVSDPRDVPGSILLAVIDFATLDTLKSEFLLFKLDLTFLDWTSTLFLSLLLGVREILSFFVLPEGFDSLALVEWFTPVEDNKGLLGQ